ncbi:MAG: segregation/condensation protein A [Dehalococcoidia bacterium]|nr:segregation/condensation protein A [Dehalococcoidia bacterium]
MTIEHDHDAPAAPEGEPQDAASAVASDVADEATPEAVAEGAVAEDGAEAAAAVPEPAIQLVLPVFHGPLDLLLHLIEDNRLDITEVSLLQVTEQYLRHLRGREQIDLGMLAEFIGIGARLLLLKSRALLPKEEQPAADDEEPEDDIRALIEALKEYRRFKQAAEFLREREVGHGTYRREVPPPQVPLPTGLGAVTLSSLVDLIRDVLERMPEEEPEAPEVRREPVRLRDRMEKMVQTLETSRTMSFRRLIESATSRTMVIVDFMAVLELIKQRYLAARQSESFGDIELVRLDGAEAPLFAQAEEDFAGV